MKTSTKTTALIICFSTVTIIGGLLTLVLVFVFTTNRWFVQTAWDIQFQNSKPLRARIEEWQPILKDLQTNKDAEQAMAITNTIAVSYADQYSRTGSSSDLLKIARWLCEQNIAFGKNNPRAINCSDKLKFAEQYLHQLSKTDATERFSKSPMPIDDAK